MKKIGILSDTHGLLRPEVLEVLSGCDWILHGGDINAQVILDQLSELAPLSVVRGNNDKEWAKMLPETLLVDCFGLKIFMVHNKKFIPKELSGVDLVVYGHSHKYEEKMLNGVHLLNPGSCGPRRFGQEITLALLYLEDDQTFQIEKILIPHAAGDPIKTETERVARERASIPPDIGLQIPAIMQEIDAGKTIKQIARKHKISEELAEQIARMYLTHPGVDVDGILRRIGL